MYLPLMILKKIKLKSIPNKYNHFMQITNINNDPLDWSDWITLNVALITPSKSNISHL